MNEATFNQKLKQFYTVNSERSESNRLNGDSDLEQSERRSPVCGGENRTIKVIKTISK